MKEIIKKEDRRIEKTKKSIRDALIYLLQEKNINQITIKELSEKANINRKTFYMHYSSIDEVLETIENEIIDNFLFLLNKYDFSKKQFDGYAFFTNLNNVINEDFDLYKKLLLSDSHNFLLNKVKKILKENIIERFHNILNEDKEILSLYTEFVASGIIAIYLEWFRTDSKLSLKDLAIAANKIAFKGIDYIFEELTNKNI